MARKRPRVRKNPRTGRPEVRYWDPHGRRRTEGGFATDADAAAWDAMNEADKRRGRWVDPAGARIRFGDWAERWWSTTVNLRPSTRARDDSLYRNHVEPAWGALQLANIDHLGVREWIAELSASGLAPTTVHKCAQILAKSMRAAVDAGLIATSPCERQPLPKVEPDEMRFMDPDEVARLADVIEPRYRGIVLVGAYGGLRAGEMFGLRAERVDALRAKVDVAEVLVEVNGHHHFGPPKTRAGRRRVPLPRFVVDTLADHVGGLAPKELVFPAPRGGPVRASLFRRRVWHPAVASSGLAPLRIHDLRHTAVALWIAAGASPKEIAARAGHTSVATVLDRYGHLYAGHETAVVDALDAMARRAHDDARDADVQQLRRNQH
jgi:integrase